MEMRMEGRLGVIGVDKRLANWVHKLKSSGVGAAEGLSMGRNGVFSDMLSPEIRSELQERVRISELTASVGYTSRPHSARCRQTGLLGDRGLNSPPDSLSPGRGHRLPP